MKFSEMYNVTLTSDDDWFDPILSMDTKLFIDPFLLYALEDGHFAGSHSDVIGFFNEVFQLIARSGGNRASVRWNKAQNLLLFPEVEELCLGYTGIGTRGSGSGRGVATLMAEALWEAVQAGLTEITHFEEIRILREGIGADRISDATASLVRLRLVAYSKEVSQRHSIPLSPVSFYRGDYDVSLKTWRPLITELPLNPYNRKPILLVPRKYLRDLPTVSAEGFWDYCYYNENETLRNEYSYDITSRVNKRAIIEFARQHPEIRRRYISHIEQQEPEPYDFSADKKGYIQWYEASSIYCASRPLALVVDSRNTFIGAIRGMVDEFQNYVENNRGWKLLWNDNVTPRREEAAQLLFLGIVKHYCKANNIDISRETNIGKGPVDFKVSQGYQLRALLELKLAKNTKFWDGLRSQLPAYQRAEGIDIGFFIVIVYTESDFQRLGAIERLTEEVHQQTGYQIYTVIVDARSNPPSASRL